MKPNIVHGHAPMGARGVMARPGSIKDRKPSARSAKKGQNQVKGRKSTKASLPEPMVGPRIKPLMGALALVKAGAEALVRMSWTNLCRFRNGYYR